jgi:hypothetical protein
MMSPDPNYLRLHRVEHQERLARAQMRYAARESFSKKPNAMLMKFGRALVAVGEYIQAQATQDARRTSAERAVTFTNELNRL